MNNAAASQEPQTGVHKPTPLHGTCFACSNPSRPPARRYEAPRLMRLRNPVRRSVRAILRDLRDDDHLPAKVSPLLYAETASRPASSSSSTFFCPRTSIWLSATLLPPGTAAATATRTTPSGVGACPWSNSRRYSSWYSTQFSSSDGTPTRTPPPSRNDAPCDDATKELLLSYVDCQHVGSVGDYLQLYNDPYFRRYAPPDGPKVIISDQPREAAFPSAHELAGSAPDLTGRLGLLLSMRRRTPRRVTLTSIYEAYRELPEPRMLHITGRMRHALLALLGTPAKKTSRAMLRYFSVVADVKACGLTLARTEWNYALALAGRYAGWTTGTEVSAAMRLWRDMEAAANVQANDVTFNILFDVASKAGNFTLAEMMLREMEARGIQSDRYHHVSLINFFGLKGDPDGVRAAYREMVDAGEMIDTVVLNCVIHGLLRTGDEAAAEAIYQNMLRQSQQQKPSPQEDSQQGSQREDSQLDGGSPQQNPQQQQDPPQQDSQLDSQKDSQKDPPQYPIFLHPPSSDYGSEKIVTRVLKMFGRISRRQPPMRAHLQRQVSIEADSRTYRILIDHYAVGRGDIKRVVQLLDEMKWARVPIDGRLYMALFKGFARHGTRIRGAWSEQRLQAVHRALVDAVEAGDTHVYLTKWLALWVLRAFARCSSRLTVFDVYVQLKRVGNFDPTSVAFLDHVTTSMMNKLQ